MQKVSASGGTEASISAIQVAINATAKLDAAGAVTNIGQDLTTVKGSLVNVQGTAVKLG
jgi:hypothetical protein